ncbi:MAG: hypothetical protein HC837_10210 [Chloroflexaceae bacterium]|nr:hypothetical protein [Chloroflexaceae bacterium]
MAQTILRWLIRILGSLASVLLVLAIRRAFFRANMQRIWISLAPTQPATTAFTPSMVADLPEPVQRYLLHAIAPGTPLAESVDLTMHGQIKLNDQWYPFEADQRITLPYGFVWAPSVNMGWISVEGADTYAAGNGRMRFDLFGLIPLVQRTGPHIDRSALGRLVIESIWLPTALLPQRGVLWQVLDAERIAATVMLGGVSHTLVFTIDAVGRLQSAMLERWSSEEQCPLPFGCTITAEQTFNGCTIPAQAQVGWYHGSPRFQSEGVFFTFVLDQARYQ